jgi:AcrR family transcriptional regulator
MPATDATVRVASPAPLRADAARNRAQVLEAARLQLSDGDTTLPMNAIARRAGVGVGTVYRHFPTRQSLLEALAQDSFATLVRETQVAAEDPDRAAGLERMLRCALRCQLDYIGLATVLATPDFECPETLALGEELVRSVTQVLDQARRAGVIRADVEADDIRRLLTGTYQAVRAGPDPSLHTEPYLQVLLRGLRPGP